MTLEDLRFERFLLGASGLGPDIRMAERGIHLTAQWHRVGQSDLIDMVALGFGVTLVLGPPPGATADGVVLVPLAGQNVIPLRAVWMDSNPNPALKGLLKIVRRSGQHIFGT